MLILLQTLLFFIGTLMTGFLLIEGWFTQAVWAKDCSQGMFANITKMASWTIKIHKDKEPNTYWAFMGFYAVAFLFFILALLT